MGEQEGMMKEFHPLSDIFPMMSGEEFDALVEDIKRNGLLEPIWLYEGKILDGRNRYKACLEAGIEPKFVEYKGDSPLAFIVSKNIKRRHLTATQRAVITLKLRPELEAEARKRQELAGKIYHRGARKEKVGAPGPQPFDRARAKEQAAALVGVSPRTVQRVWTVAEKAPDLIPKLESGELSAKQAEKEVKRRLRQTLKTTKQPSASVQNAVIYKRDALEFLQDLEPESADLLLTDPPYMTEIEDIEGFAKTWVPLALSRIKPTGRAYIFTGSYPKELWAYLSVLLGQDRFSLANVLVWTYRNTLGPTPKMTYKNNWQAIFYLHGPEAPPLDCPIMVEQFAVQDINAPDGRFGERFHTWEKPIELAERLIRHSTKEGDLIIDPFAGTGTFLLAAARLNRRAKGCDVSQKMIEIAVKRGCRHET